MGRLVPADQHHGVAPGQPDIFSRELGIKIKQDRAQWNSPL
jgi:hypothetical protein